MMLVFLGFACVNRSGPNKQRLNDKSSCAGMWEDGLCLDPEMGQIQLIHIVSIQSISQEGSKIKVAGKATR